jgi:hypothetical protein
MPLLTCPDCQKEISDRAPACPHCGAPIAAPVPVAVKDSALSRNRGCGDLALYGLGVPLILGALGLLAWLLTR